MSLFDFYPNDLPITVEFLSELDYERRHVMEEKEMTDTQLEKLREGEGYE